VSYTEGALVALDEDGLLLVRTAILDDDVFEGAETFQLIASNTGGTAFDGTATILDDGTGDYWIDDEIEAATGQDLLDAGIVLNDDRPLTIADVAVNEASPYVVFTISGGASQLVSLALAETGDGEGHATLGEDFGADLEYWDGSEWVTYADGDLVALDENGLLLVRTAIFDDEAFEGSETFQLVATNTGGSAFDGTATILDDGTGDYWIGDEIEPATEEELDAAKIILDDDRPFAVNSIDVNEGSAFGVFTVTSLLDDPSEAAGQLVSLSLAAGTATSEDFGTLEYFDGDSWQPYTAGNLVPLDADGQLFVRVAIVNDEELENAHDFTITARGGGGQEADGTGTILDDGTGDYWIGDATAPATPKELDDAGIDLDDDRLLAVNSITVNEGSPYAVFTVSGAPGQLASLLLGAEGDTATAADYGPGLEVFVDGAWIAYTPGQFVELDAQGVLLVRVAITADDEFETSEFFTLSVTNTGGVDATGTGVIRDDGTGELFGPDNTSGTPDQPGENGLAEDLILDDDRRPFVKENVYLVPLPNHPTNFSHAPFLSAVEGSNLKLQTTTTETIIQTAQGGTVMITGRTVTYTPPLGGLPDGIIDSFQYTVFNEFGQDTGTVLLTSKERALTLPIKIISATNMDGGGKRVRLCALPMTSYQIYATSSLTANSGSVIPEGNGDWVLIGIFTANERGDIYVNDANAGSQRFYRLRLKP
jgi:hypothetical protein